MYDEETKARDPLDRLNKSYPGGIGGATTAGVISVAREQVYEQATESMRSRLHRKACESANDAARRERLAEKLTPDIETVLWCLRECIALGVIDVEELIKSGTRQRLE